MEVRFIAWFLFILCTHCLTCLGFEGFPTSKVEDFNLTEPKFGGQLHGMQSFLYSLCIERAKNIFCRVVNVSSIFRQ